MQQKEPSFASSSCDVLRHGREGLIGNRVGPWSRVQTLERLREQIRCLEGRTPAFEPVKQDTQPSGRSYLRSTGCDGGAGNGAERHCLESPYGMSQDVSLQAGLPADRFVDEDGCVVSPTITPATQPSSSFSPSPLVLPSDHLPSLSGERSPRWTLAPSRAGSVVEPNISHGGGGFIFSPAEIELDQSGVHEIKPAFEGMGDTVSGHQSLSGWGMDDWAAAANGALGFFVCLIARRLAGFRADQKDALGTASQGCVDGLGSAGRTPLLWCSSRAIRGEYGLPYIHGLEALGVRPSDLMIVETANTAETLWVLEEGMRSRAPVLVAGILDDIGLTPARRLALAAERYGVPCLVLSDARSPPAAATASRWRVGSSSSGDNELEIARQARNPRGQALRLPGAHRFCVALERYRPAPVMAGRDMHLVEWRHEAVCFDLVSAVSDRPFAASAGQAGAPG